MSPVDEKDRWREGCGLPDEVSSRVVERWCDTYIPLIEPPLLVCWWERDDQTNETLRGFFCSRLPHLVIARLCGCRCSMTQWFAVSQQWRIMFGEIGKP
jgi:hypothetical protein